MKRAVAWVLLALCLLVPGLARAEGDEIDRLTAEIDAADVQSSLDSAGVDLGFSDLSRRIAKNEAALDPEAIVQAALELLRSALQEMTGFALGLCAPLWVWAVLRQMTGGQSGAVRCAGYVCYLSAAGVLIALFMEQVSLARSAIDGMNRVTENLFPILTALLVSTGAASTAAIFTPMATLAAGVVSSVAYRFAFMLSGCAAMLVVAGRFSESLKLDGAAKLTINLSNWTMGICVTAFLGLMTVQGVLGTSYDGVSIRTARYTVDNLLPVIGGEVADTMDIMVTSALIVKNAAGVTGMIAVLAVCVGPIARLLSAIVVVKLVSAVMEPIAEGPVSALIDRFSGVLTMLLVATVSSMLIFLVLIGAVLGSGRVLWGG